jgi:carbonyl reductase 1
MREFVADVQAGRHRERGWPSSAYSVSKIGLTRITQILAPSLAERGILCNAACPGWVRTDMGGRSAPRSPAQGADTPLWLALLDADGPTGGLFRDRGPASW